MPSSSPTRQTSRRSSSTSTQVPAEAGKTTWSPGLTGMVTPTCSHQSRPGPTASTMPSWGGGSCVPGGTSRPLWRKRSGSSSLTTTRSNRGRRFGRPAAPHDTRPPLHDQQRDGDRHRRRQRVEGEEQQVPGGGQDEHEQRDRQLAAAL